MNEKKPKITIIGAGAVGMRYAYSLMIKSVAREIVIIDLDRKKAEGEVMDLNHGMPYLSPVKVSVGDYPDLKGSDLVVITCGAKQKPGQTRLDLVKTNVAIFGKIIPSIMEYAPESLFLIVSNPVDVLAYAAYKFSGKDWRTVIGSGTVLDSARLRYLLSDHCKIDSRNIHAYVLGEHGDTEFPVWSKAMVGGISFDKYCPVCKRCPEPERLKQEIFEKVKNSAYQIIERKGETSYGIGLALVRITQAILKDENAVLPVSVLVQGNYGINDVYLSLPAVLNSSGIREIMPITFNDKEKNDLKKSADALKSVIHQCGL